MGPSVVLDLEIANDKEEDESWDNFKRRCEISCGVLYDQDRDQWEFYTRRNLADLRTRVENAGQIVTYNGRDFDLPVLARNLGLAGLQDLAVDDQNHLDLWHIFKHRIGPDTWPAGSWKLGAVCERTLGIGKLASGAHAPLLWREQRYGELFTYCARDVWLTSRLHKFILDHGYVVDPNGYKMIVGERS